MDLQLLLGLILTILPIAELRGGLPIVIDYCLKNGLKVFPFFLLVVFLNIITIIFIFFFLEFFHKHLLKWNFYNKVFNKFLKRIRKKNDIFEEKFNQIGYLALILFVAIPLPITGAWTGTLLAWLMGLDKKKSIASIALGVFIAGLVILFSSLGILGIFYS